MTTVGIPDDSTTILGISMHLFRPGGGGSYIAQRMLAARNAAEGNSERVP